MYFAYIEVIGFFNGDGMAKGKKNKYWESLRNFVKESERKKEDKRDEILKILRGAVPEFIK